MKEIQANSARLLPTTKLFTNFFPQCALRQEVWSQITNYKKFPLVRFHIKVFHKDKTQSKKTPRAACHMTALLSKEKVV